MSTINLNNEEFFSLDFYIDNRVLIPRNDTETLVYQVLKEIKNENTILIDVWTWSGCIPIAIIKNLKFDLKKTYALDISLEALEVAQINRWKYLFDEKIVLVNSDLLSVFDNFKLEKIDSDLIITANLPYIKNEDYKNMDKEVYLNEPHIALFGWEITWFELYEKLISQIIELKKIANEKQKIVLFIEIWFDQYEYSKKYLTDLWLKFGYFKDLNNIWRIIKIEF